MFAKPYKLKANNALKNSEKKHLAQRVKDEFPFATEEKVKELVPLKGNCTCLKLVLHSGDFVNVYAIDGIPMLLEVPEGLIPTVCALWKVPDLVPILTIHSPVLAKVQNGAPLYLPGVSLPAQGAGFPVFPCGTLLGARTEDNAAACLVGRAAMSSADMLLRASGVCLDILHVYGDALCKDQKFSKIERPKLGQPKTTSAAVSLADSFQQIAIQPAKEEWPSLGPQPRPPAPAAPVPAPAPTPTPAPTPAPRAPNEPALIPADSPQMENGEPDQANDTMHTESPPEDEVPTDMDELLRWCLLSFLKLEGKRVELPLKTNLLYKNHLHPQCPPDRTLDVKKSSYKKLGKFLEAMQQEGLVEVREVDKGVSAVVAMNAAHPAVRLHRAAPRPAGTGAAPAPSTRYTPPLVRDMYCITASVQELFAPLKKGTAVTAAEARLALAQYVRARGLDSTGTETKGAVALDATLAAILNQPQQETVRWDALMSGVLARMTASTELRFADGGVRLSKARLAPVSMAVAQRSGNKKVTLVSNLEAFGFNLQALAHECQLRIAASCGVTRSAAARCDQLMLQGDQTHFVAKLLIEKYELPKKFLEGADKALNKKR